MNFNYETLHPELQEVYNMYKTNADDHGRPFAEVVNTMLRSDTLQPEYQHWIDKLDEIVLSGYSNKSKILFRATNEVCVRAQIINGVIVDPGFLSTADDRTCIVKHFNDTIAGQFAVLEIHCPKGRKMVPMDSSPFNGSSEFEWLLPRGARLKILDERIMSNNVWLNHLFGMKRTLYQEVESVTYFETELIF